MGWIHRNNNSANGASTTLAVTAGDLIVVFVTSLVTGETVSDDVNGSYTRHIDQVSDRPSQQSIHSKIATTTTTVTITSGGSPDAIHASSFGHSGGTIPNTANTTGGASGAQTVNLTTSVADTLLVGCGDASISNDAGSGFTAIGQTVNAHRLTSEYETDLTNSTGTNTVALVEGVQRSIAAVAFDPPVAAVAPEEDGEWIIVTQNW